MIFLRIFYEFFITGLFAVGGGLATIPFLTDMAAKTGWFTSAQLADMIAISESTPGPIGINMASYVGYTSAGIPGVLVATIGIITPSIIVILIIASFLQRFRDNRFVKAAFYGLRPASVALIAVAAISVLKISLFNIPAWQESGQLVSLFNYKSIILAVTVFILMRLKMFKKLHPIVFLALSAVAGIVFGFAA